MILVFGGTTEGKQAIEVLEALQLQYIYSSKTEIKVELGDCGIYRFGAFSVENLEQFISDKNITAIIHASHPFAEELHRTIDVVAEKCEIPVYRLQREYPERIQHAMIHYVDDYEDALTLLHEKFNGKILLGLTGVQTIVKFENFWKNNLSYFRILDRPSSKDIALKSNFPESQLILGYPNTSVEAEVALFQQKIIEVVITKESGNSGALSVKIDAAKHCNIPIVIIKKPELPISFQLVNNKSALLEILKTTVQ
ncbi:precorrin-6A/cobalt-precorrin-6A reductase [Lutibacter agarilyticus]|uniref:Precorrin-6A/cobalt-precorrin-6A reductase n=1 Tax=Lutibacter agarilyticus TaxID=1109740 RepID=A0A238WYC6_9FLAO|nr:precorrin-6A reductase [Lutibacter agarilyticus]SNR51567.1 precorrin-6A/cobalt-precorrin-6A reductase [Lutibacter agarilyticus]